MPQIAQSAAYTTGGVYTVPKLLAQYDNNSQYLDLIHCC